MSTGHPGEEPRATRAVRVQAIFHVSEDQQEQTVVAKMIDRAHEIANLPECECDVDVSVEMVSPGGSQVPESPTGGAPHGLAPNF